VPGDYGDRLPASAQMRLEAILSSNGVLKAARMLGITPVTFDAALGGTVRPATVAKIMAALERL
jgi:hypothetical protein